MYAASNRSLAGRFRVHKALRIARTSALALATGCLLLPPAQAHLGSFQPADGYNISVTAGAANWCDVTYYDAGQYGANAGGGSGPNSIVPDSGLWTLQSPVGGFFPTAAARTAALSGSPPYPNSVPPGTVAAYMVGNHFPGRGGDGSNLAFRNDTPFGTGPAIYDYALDSYDMGSVPSSITSGNVLTEFYFCPNPADPPNPAGASGDKFTMSFQDSSATIGLQWGYARDNTVTWRTNPSGSWNTTSIIADSTDWDGLRVDIDLSNDTFQMDYYDKSANTWLNLAPAGTALNAPLTNLTNLGWQLEDGVSTGTGGKNYFDDFHFSTRVPEPSGLALAAAAVCGAAIVARRKRGSAPPSTTES